MSDNYNEKRIDTRGEKRVIGFKDVGASADGKWARIVFLESDRKTELPIQFASDIFGKMLPTLLQLDGECARRRDGDNIKQVFRVKEGDIIATNDGDIVFEFKVPSGQHFAFELDQASAKLMLSALSQILELEQFQKPNDIPPTRPQ